MPTITGSVATKSRYGPVRPKSVTDVMTGRAAGPTTSAGSSATRSLGTTAVDPDVGAGEQVEEALAVAVVVEVEGDEPLVRVADGEEQALAVVERPDAARRRAARRLDPHDVGAEVGEQPRRELGPLVGEVDDPQAGQG